MSIGFPGGPGALRAGTSAKKGGGSRVTPGFLAWMTMNQSMSPAKRKPAATAPAANKTTKNGARK